MSKTKEADIISSGSELMFESTLADMFESTLADAAAAAVVASDDDDDGDAACLPFIYSKNVCARMPCLRFAS